MWGLSFFKTLHMDLRRYLGIRMRPKHLSWRLLEVSICFYWHRGSQEDVHLIEQHCEEVCYDLLPSCSLATSPSSSTIWGLEILWNAVGGYKSKQIKSVSSKEFSLCVCSNNWKKCILQRASMQQSVWKTSPQGFGIQADLAYREWPCMVGYSQEKPNEVK